MPFYGIACSGGRLHFPYLVLCFLFRSLSLPGADKALFFPSALLSLPIFPLVFSCLLVVLDRVVSCSHFIILRQRRKTGTARGGGVVPVRKQPHPQETVFPATGFPLVVTTADFVADQLIMRRD